MEELTAPTEGWDFWRDYLRKGIHYKLDIAGVVGLLGPERADALIARASVLRPGQEKYMRYTEIYECARREGVLPELLVDEEYYYRRCCLAPHRLAFQALRNGIDCWELYLRLLAIGRPASPRSLVSLLRGLDNANRRICMDLVIDACLVVGLEPGDLFRPRCHVVRRRTALFDQLRGVLGALDDADVAALAGIAVAMARGGGSSEILEVLTWREEVKRDADCARRGPGGGDSCGGIPAGDSAQVVCAG